MISNYAFLMTRVSTLSCLFLLCFLGTPALAAKACISRPISNALDFVLATDLPSLPSEHTKRAVRDPDAALQPIFARINDSLFPASQGFQLKFSENGNVNCDTQRKYILVDPRFFNGVFNMEVDRDLAIAALFAHEISHYIFSVYEAQSQEKRGPLVGLLSSRALAYPVADWEHLQVETLAAKIMLRAGYSISEIRRGFQAKHTALQSFLNQLTAAFGKSMGVSTDLNSRRKAIAKWIAENSAKPQNQCPTPKADAFQTLQNTALELSCP